MQSKTEKASGGADCRISVSGVKNSPPPFRSIPHSFYKIKPMKHLSAPVVQTPCLWLKYYQDTTPVFKELYSQRGNKIGMKVAVIQGRRCSEVKRSSHHFPAGCVPAVPGHLLDHIEECSGFMSRHHPSPFNFCFAPSSKPPLLLSSA